MQQVSYGLMPQMPHMKGFRSYANPQLGPQQMNLLSQLLSGVSSGQGGGGIQGGLQYLNRLAGGSKEGFEELEAPYQSAFQGALGQIGSRFAGTGALGSSAFQNATSGAAKGLAETLGAQRMGIQQNALQSLLGLSQSLLGQRPYETGYVQKPRHWLAEVSDLIGKVAPSLITAFA